MNAKRYDFSPPITGPVERVPRPHLVRPGALEPAEGPLLLLRPRAGRFSSSRSNSRCRVRSDGAHPDVTCRIRRTCAAVRPGFSRFSASASARTSSGVRGAGCRGDGTSASNPPSS